jgi:crotonobetainyl-CoA:carnitine CoA-transferase CaiB-like acyl-CoA transferase
MSESTAAAGRTSVGALAGVRVVDLSRVLAGPLCTQMLADHGADVIKVEPPSGDETRLLGPPFTPDGDAAYFYSVNRGKRAISLDLSSAEGRAALERLLDGADVLVENFLPGTTKRWGIDYETLSRRDPRLIYCSISGFGADGPLGGLPGYDAVLQAMCGLMSINGTPESGPMRMGVPVVDHLTSYTALTGILMALYVRSITGKGQKVEATLFDAALSLLVPHAANWFYSDRAPTLLGNAHPNISPYDKFKARDGELFLGVVNDGQFRRLCEHIGRTDLASDPRFASNALRVQNVAALRGELEGTLASLPVEALCRDLMTKGVPAGPVHSVPQAFSQSHAAHRGMQVKNGDYRGIGVPVKLSVTPGQPGRRPPRFDEHADIVAEVNTGDNK